MKFEIPSNSGRNSIELILIGVKNIENLIFNAKINEMFFCRGSDNKDLVKEHSFEIFQIVVSLSRLQELKSNLDEWNICYKGFSTELCDASMTDQKMRISLSEREELIYSVDKPALTFLYSSGTVNLEKFFVVDQSCISIALDGLKELVRSP